MTLAPAADPGFADAAPATATASRVSARDRTVRMLGNSHVVASLDNDAPAYFEGSTQFARRVTGP